jgi:hypothetical protein
MRFFHAVLGHSSYNLQTRILLCLGQEMSLTKSTPHYLTHSFTHQVCKSGELQLGEEGRERHIAQCWIFSSFLVYCLGIVLAIYIKEFLLGFLPHEGFPG